MAEGVRGAPRGAEGPGVGAAPRQPSQRARRVTGIPLTCPGPPRWAAASRRPGPPTPVGASCRPMAPSPMPRRPRHPPPPSLPPPPAAPWRLRPLPAGLEAAVAARAAPRKAPRCPRRPTSRLRPPPFAVTWRPGLTQKAARGAGPGRGLSPPTWSRRPASSLCPPDPAQQPRTEIDLATDQG